MLKINPTFTYYFYRYDNHIITTGVARLADKGVNMAQYNLEGLSMNTEKFRTLKFGTFQFMDSLSFFNASLEKIIADLVDSDHGFPILKRSGWVQNNKQLNLLTRKGVFPYSALRSLQEFQETTEMIPKEAFYNDLYEEHISDSDYEHARKVFKEFKCNNMEDYLLLYNATDVFLLAEGLMEFREIVHKTFKVDLFQYISIPQLTQDAFLLYSGAEIELMSDADMFIRMEQNIRGGMSFIGCRHAEKTEDKVISLIDANNLYGFALSQKLPIGDYEELSEKEYSKIDWTKQTMEQDHGYIVTVTMEAPQEVHDDLEQFPPAPHRHDITYDMLSPYAKRALHACCESPEKYKATKLIGSFLPKKEYAVHHANLRLYLELGYKLVQIHNVIRFRQEYIFKVSFLQCTYGNIY